MPPEILWSLAGLAAYLLGAVPFALILGKALKGIDLRDHGSGNLGATNALRVLGKKLGGLVLLLDVIKGLVPVLAFPPLLALLGAPPPIWLAAVLAGLAILGHVFPVYLRFKGGKGVATSAGAFLALHPIAFAVALGVFVLAVAVTRYVSLGSILAAVALPASAIIIDEAVEGHWEAFGTNRARTIMLLLVAALVIVRHRANIRRLFKGTESRLGSKSGGVDPEGASPGS